MKIYWGDLHNHCAVSYGHGTAARALDNARQHLDFCSITGHAFWPDMPMDLQRQNRIIGMHLGGFAKLQHYWKDLLRELESANRAGEFVTLPSYEWHSMEFGDHNCYFDAFDIELIDGRDRENLAQNLREAGKDFMMIPHHCGYVRGQRGLNWEAFDESVSPLVEIFSNHGSGEADDAPYDYHHSMGPRVGESMVRKGLAAGRRFGFAASTDSHDGYPGHYGHGRVGVLADGLELSSIWKALKERRTIATTGAAIRVEARLEYAGIGEVLKRRKDDMFLLAEIEGTAPIERVDLVEGCGGDVRVRRLAGNDTDLSFSPGRYKVKVECGWGRGSDRSDWRVDCELHDGKLTGCDRCFRHSTYPMDELKSSEGILEISDRKVVWVCRAAPNPAGAMGGTHFNASGTQAVVLDIDAGERTRLKVRSGEIEFDLAVSELVKGSVGRQVAGFGSAALKVHRAVPEREFSYRYEDSCRPLNDGQKGFVYLRIAQSDGQVAWVSPIWYE